MKGDFGDGFGGVFEQIPGLIHAQSHPVVAGGHAGVAAEEADKDGGRESGVCGEGMNGDVGGGVAAEELEAFADQGGGALGAFKVFAAAADAVEEEGAEEEPEAALAFEGVGAAEFGEETVEGLADGGVKGDGAQFAQAEGFLKEGEFVGGEDAGVGAVGFGDEPKEVAGGDDVGGAGVAGMGWHDGKGVAVLVEGGAVFEGPGGVAFEDEGEFDGVVVVVGVEWDGVGKIVKAAGAEPGDVEGLAGEAELGIADHV